MPRPRLTLPTHLTLDEELTLLTRAPGPAQRRLLAMLLRAYGRLSDESGDEFLARLHVYVAELRRAPKESVLRTAAQRAKDAGGSDAHWYLAAAAAMVLGLEGN